MLGLFNIFLQCIFRIYFYNIFLVGKELESKLEIEFRAMLFIIIGLKQAK
jgi:hypothetical protein